MLRKIFKKGYPGNKTVNLIVHNSESGIAETIVFSGGKDMRITKSIAMALLAGMVLGSLVWGKSVGVLLQEGIYQQETAGNLDKAIEIYQQVLVDAPITEPVAAQANYQLGLCYLKKGDKNKAKEYFQKVTTQNRKQEELVQKALQQMALLEPKSTEDSFFEKLPSNVILFIGDKFGSICADAGLKNLYSNAHIYFVDSDFIVRNGGMGYYYNFTPQPVTSKVRLSGTSYPNQSFYDVAGRKMNVEIVPDKDRPKFYHIYWTPEEPLAPKQYFSYGWSLHGSRKLFPIDEKSYSLTMQNHFGDPVVETFFLVLPAQLKIVRQDEDYSSKETVCEYDVYYWSKELPKDTNHKVGIVLAKTDGSESSVQSAEELTAEGWKLWGKQKFSESAEFFRKAMGQEPWSQSLNAVRKPLGAVKERKVLSSTFTTQAPGAPDGKYVVIQFQSSFANKASAVETVTPMLDSDGAWRVSGYYIR